ncbi:hypothetical protein C8N46_101163 [Kordia periserrulae]|uniref:Uncharacterized protein n=1 Tax=Kordia periserrulae TaxID=701523 RepID=A0A2T6C5I8_9FLAO|nr:hypothetical protein [Kordia periserrulae]PTX63562.1 hypothetical protein C8N46_101163 [Kordia periserrulae]
MENNNNQEVSKEFFLENLISRIISVKKRLDYLVFILVVVTFFGLYFMNVVPKKFIFFELDGLNPSVYHGVIAVSLLVVFGILGSHFIEYVLKRNMIDKELKFNPFFKGKRWREERKDMNVEKGNEKLLIVSSTVAPSSFYEFFYTLDLTLRNLRSTASIVLLFVFFLSHAVAYFHILKLQFHFGITEGLGVLLFVCYALLYVEFIKSIKRIKKRLYEVIAKPLLYISIAYVVLIIAIRMYFIFFN